MRLGDLPSLSIPRQKSNADLPTEWLIQHSSKVKVRRRGQTSPQARPEAPAPWHCTSTRSKVIQLWETFTLKAEGKMGCAE